MVLGAMGKRPQCFVAAFARGCFRLLNTDARRICEWEPVACSNLKSVSTFCPNLSIVCIWLICVGHEESYRDVPRLSTIQAMILLLKAREHQPKRGYFYRSWMTVVNCVIMAKDLELDEHFELHQSGRHCNFTLAECVTRTRVWQNLFVLEIMIGGPQGLFLC